MLTSVSQKSKGHLVAAKRGVQRRLRGVKGIFEIFGVCKILDFKIFLPGTASTTLELALTLTNTARERLMTGHGAS